MSTKHVRSAAVLPRSKCVLRIERGSCGNSTTVNGFDVAKAYGTRAFSEIKPRMNTRDVVRRTLCERSSPRPLRVGDGPACLRYPATF